MTQMIEAVMVLLVLTNLLLLGTSRLATCIRTVAIQGVALGTLPVLGHAHELSLRLVLLAVGSASLKGVVFPFLLFRAMREADVRHEIEPFVGYTASILIGIGSLAVSVWASSRITLPGPAVSSLVLPAALFTILVGLFVIVSRRKALMQVIGYLAMENGIYAFGVVLVGEIPMLVELGVLLDVFVAVLVMGIAIYHIRREYDHIDVDELDALKG
ncbi:MAG: hydrogenase [Planctomycetes bacterium]|nr:hydrogenase [Planctomycetota bacterium]